MWVVLRRLKPWQAWAALFLLSLAGGTVLTALHFPAAVLLACMVSGIVLSSGGLTMAVPTPLFALSQGVLGCLMAQSLRPEILHQVVTDWPIFLGATLSIIVASAMLGWLLMRWQTLPGTTAVWGLAPGAASAMVLMAQEYGADVRLVAFMQYLRVVIVTACASLVAHLWAPQSASAVADVAWFAVANQGNLSSTLLIAFGGSIVARRLKIPAGPMIAPLILATLLQGMGVLVIELPPVLLGVAYATIGWSIGLRFNAVILQHAFRALPQVLGAIGVLMAVGAIIAYALTRWADFDGLTAYLATSPGGADSVAVIAATTAVDAGFVMAMQVGRFAMVLVFGPHVSKFVAERFATKPSV